MSLDIPNLQLLASQPELICFQAPRCSQQVGLLDIDICGPSVPKMLGLEGEEIHQSGAGWSPVYVQVRCKRRVFSIAQPQGSQCDLAAGRIAACPSLVH